MYKRQDAYTDVAFTLKMRKDGNETLLTQGTSVKLKNTATGTESAPATVDENGTVTFNAVSYTHLDVYKRQIF